MRAGSCEMYLSCFFGVVPFASAGYITCKFCTCMGGTGAFVLNESILKCHNHLISLMRSVSKLLC
jgi:hypothetical protein